MTTLVLHSLASPAMIAKTPWATTPRGSSLCSDSTRCRSQPRTCVSLLGAG